MFYHPVQQRPASLAVLHVGISPVPQQDDGSGGLACPDYPAQQGFAIQEMRLRVGIGSRFQQHFRDIVVSPTRQCERTHGGLSVAVGFGTDSQCQRHHVDFLAADGHAKQSTGTHGIAHTIFQRQRDDRRVVVSDGDVQGLLALYARVGAGKQE